MQPLAARIDALARARPDAMAFLSDTEDLSWAEYARRSDRFAAASRRPRPRAGRARRGAAARRARRARRLRRLREGRPRGGRHRPARGARRRSAIWSRSRARPALVTRPASATSTSRAVRGAARRGRAARGTTSSSSASSTPTRRCYAGGPAAPADLAARRLGVDDLFLLNSTSGTTGLPKCVMHDQARWFHFHELAVDARRADAGATSSARRCPRPSASGSGRRTSRRPLLGAPCVVLDALRRGGDAAPRSSATASRCSPPSARSSS